MLLYRAGLYLKLMRLHQPTGVWLLLWPCLWSIAMATQSPWPDLYLMGLFIVGAISMRGAGCIVNDIIDRKIDAQVTRTKMRPLASGQLRINQAVWMLVVLLVFGLAVVINLNSTAITLSLLSIIPVIIYPYMKRIMAWPQIFLAATFNLGAIIGWSAVTGNIATPSLAIYAACFFWTLGYDTIYAHQDKKDDAKVGIKSSALSMQSNTKIYVPIFYFIMIFFLMMAGSMTFVHHNLVYYSSLIIALLHLAWQIKFVNLDNPASCMKKFKSNGWFGWIIFLGIIIEKKLSYM